MDRLGWGRVSVERVRDKIGFMSRCRIGWGCGVNFGHREV